MKQKLGPRQETWLAELRSGRYEQGVGGLANTKGGYCCLGVACNTFSKILNLTLTKVVSREHFLYNGMEAVLPRKVQDYLGLKQPNGGGGVGTDCKLSLGSMNDSGNYNFEEICAEIERKPSFYFIEAL